MAPNYLHLNTDIGLPEQVSGPFRAIIVSDIAVANDWRNKVTDWLVANNCLYVVAWGVDCEQWHDAADWAVLEAFDYNDIPDDKFVMTTWHDDEPLSEAFWFAGNCAFHPDVELCGTTIVHIAKQAKEAELLELYDSSQAMPGDEA